MVAKNKCVRQIFYLGSKTTFVADCQEFVSFDQDHPNQSLAHFLLVLNYWKLASHDSLHDKILKCLVFREQEENEKN